MLFNSYLFWCFYLAVICIYFFLSHRKQNILLLLSSYIFYGSWDWRFLSLIIISTCVDWVASHKIASTDIRKRQKLFMIISIVCNLGLLGVFKYYNFFIGEFVTFLQSVGVTTSAPTLAVILPVGISFYTFQTMSYTVDVYHGKTKPAESFLDFALFVCFFPQLVAGPIMRFSKLMPQIKNKRVHRPEDFAEGLYHILFGLFKKVVIADNMANIVNAVFATEVAELTGPECFLGILAFAFQIYGDFSGYSSIAQGIGKWLGFDLIYNFRLPYFAKSPSDFWLRWHISLSGWLRDYLYISLGGNRGGTFLTYRNLILTMLLGGLWHGAGRTFVAWGLYHGIILCLYRLLPRRTEGRPSSWRGALSMSWMFILTLGGWLLFRAESMSQVTDMAVKIAVDFQGSSLAVYMLGSILFFPLPMMAYEFILYRKNNDMLWILAKPWPLRAGFYTYLVTMLLFFSPEGIHDFIYFQF